MSTISPTDSGLKIDAAAVAAFYSEMSPRAKQITLVLFASAVVVGGGVYKIYRWSRKPYEVKEATKEVNQATTQLKIEKVQREVLIQQTKATQEEANQRLDRAKLVSQEIEALLDESLK